MEKSLKIAILTSPPSRCSGVTTHVKLLCKELSLRGHSVFLLCKKTKYAEEMITSEINPCWINADQNHKTLRNALGDILKMRSLFREQGIDIVHAHHRWLAMLTRIANLGVNIPTIWTDHSELVGKKMLTKLLASYIVSVSEMNKRRLINLFGIPCQKIEVIYNAASPFQILSSNEINIFRKQFGLLEARPLIVAVGELIDIKGFNFLIETIALLKDKYPTIGLAIAGSGNHIEKYYYMANHLGVKDKVKLLGLVENVAALVNTADVFVSSSLSEGMPLNIIEAMSLGKAIVATKVGGVPEIIDSGVNGLLVPPADSKALADAIARILDDPNLSTFLGHNARQQYERLLSVPRNLDKVENLYFKAVAGST